MSKGEIQVTPYRRQEESDAGDGHRLEALTEHDYKNVYGAVIYCHHLHVVYYDQERTARPQPPFLWLHNKKPDQSDRSGFLRRCKSILKR
ncbi:MAG: hypothetical protein HYV00_06880 [Deltaproteobacteria bacterium]|nr:hypothetical protein [Deltaproteobacteria bacterium]